MARKDSGARRQSKTFAPMAVRRIVLTYEQTSLEDLPTETAALCYAAREATRLAYAPYSRFRVGVAAEVDGVARPVLAANVENAAYPQCLCAEAALLGRIHAQHPGSPIRRIAIAVEGEGAAAEGAGPCGGCRQQLFEAEARQGGQPIALLLVGGDGGVRVIGSCRDLLPLGFAFGGAR